MRSLLICLSVGILSSSLHAGSWDPEDVTFDPTIRETIANGASRIGDPSPFRQDGYDIVGYTHLQAKADPVSGVLVWVSMIVPFVPEKMGKPGGASMFLSVEQAEALQKLLVESIEDAGRNDRKEVGVVVDNPSYETWKVFVDGTTEAPIVLHRKRGDDVEQYRFSLNPAKKMLDTLNYFIDQAKPLAEAAK